MGRWSTKSVLFNGTTQYGTAGNVLNFEYTDACSYSAWFKTTAGGVILSKQTDLPSARGMVLMAYTGVIVFGLVNYNATNQLQIGTIVNSWADGEWHHVAVTKSTGYTYSGGAFHIYGDGEDQALSASHDTLTSTILTTEAFQVGRRGVVSSPLYFGGGVDEPAIYNVELTADEVGWIYDAGMPNDLKHANAPAGLVSWWNMGENIAGAVVPDQQGSNDITLVNSPTIQTDAPEGVGYSGNNISTAILPSYGFKPAHAYEASLITADLHTFKTSAGGGGGPTVYFKMRARDTGVAAPGYVTWVSSPDPDFGGLGYSGGSPTPVGIMVPGSAQVVARWEE